MTTRRGRAIAGLLASLTVWVAVPAVWSASAPAEVAGSRTAITQSGPPPAPASSPGLWRSAPVRPPAPAPAPPVEVDIAGVGVVAAIDPVGVGRDGSMVIPKNAHRVGWYEHGATPGSAQGSAVLAGHVDSRRHGRGAMFALRNVTVGEPVRVRLADGTIIGYRVVARELLAKVALPVTELFSRAGPPRLTLITCGGDYDPASGGYQDNLVVTAVPEGPTGSTLAADVQRQATIVRMTGVA